MKTALLEFLNELERLHSHSLVQLVLIYLSFLKIVHLCSSKLRANSKGTKKISPSLKIQVCRSNKIIQLLIVLLTFYLSISSSSKNWSSDDTFSLPSVLFSLMIVSFVSFMDSLVLPIVL